VTLKADFPAEVGATDASWQEVLEQADDVTEVAWHRRRD
jgi:hypothetical protein